MHTTSDVPLGLAALVLAWLGIGVWMAWTQSVYLRAYERKTGVDLSLDFDAKYIDRPWLWFADMPRNLKRTFDVQLTRQSDPELEVLRRRYIIARWVFFGSFIAMLLLLAVFFSSPA